MITVAPLILAAGLLRPLVTRADLDFEAAVEELAIATASDRRPPEPFRPDRRPGQRLLAVPGGGIGPARADRGGNRRLPLVVLGTAVCRPGNPAAVQHDLAAALGLRRLRRRRPVHGVQTDTR